jgi:hypothetical protein
MKFTKNRLYRLTGTVWRLLWIRQQDYFLSGVFQPSRMLPYHWKNSVKQFKIFVRSKIKISVFFFSEYMITWESFMQSYIFQNQNIRFLFFWICDYMGEFHAIIYFSESNIRFLFFLNIWLHGRVSCNHI